MRRIQGAERFRGVLRGAAAFRHVRLHVVANGATTPAVEGHLVSGEYFQLLGVTPALGRLLGPEDDRTPGADPAVVLSDAYWSRTFGRARDVIGRALEAELDAVLVRQRLLALLGGLFALLAVSLACVGLYGLLSFVVTRRTSEIGVRMALGAAPGHVLRMVMGLAGGIVGAGVVLGALLSAVLVNAVGDRLLSLLYATDLVDPWAAGGAVTLFALTAALAAYLPAVRASRTSPLSRYAPSEKQRLTDGLGRRPAAQIPSTSR